MVSVTLNRDLLGSNKITQMSGEAPWGSSQGDLDMINKAIDAKLLLRRKRRQQQVCLHFRQTVSPLPAATNGLVMGDVIAPHLYLCS